MGCSFQERIYKENSIYLLQDTAAVKNSGVVFGIISASEESYRTFNFGPNVHVFETHRSNFPGEEL